MERFFFHFASTQLKKAIVILKRIHFYGPLCRYTETSYNTFTAALGDSTFQEIIFSSLPSTHNVKLCQILTTTNSIQRQIVSLRRFNARGLLHI